ncbi:sulfate ABC transporter permease subunit CysW [Leptospira mayottensis]|uniref:Sulfate ABC transporter, permease protein CysW n=2 Tax=Leptospira mayottensis TaxID=1137606 RepID=A0AA87MTH3_9LEPT|nr:sulfate ABC transporter permease subunit CysW [Leptospira mayottensis]AXR61928.1 sulfate ABC transporter permease subunit CysW [Leptospira mayottensis]AXR65840.1 sulfate ABC transporter permease subunit CysW [Leptospira mayottensis]AXR69508.1 sulfate ABC transporter permease subunit CysW [Leptospira mayottensis]AZQ01620.1 sulfate ABC transporter permease subunit CysW [Leptospira mayottensis 200901116]EKS01725.1 sulfate ABC transporter, permease protein CysW [Leptospira mayottensis 200901122
MRQESLLVRSILIGAVFFLTGLILILPIYTVFHEAFSKGFRAYLEGIQEPDTVSALKLTLLVVSIAVPLNTVFGIVSAFSLTRFEFPGKSWLLTIIDSPFSVSPVISGLIFILLFGRQGWFGPWLEKMDIKIVFNIPGLVIATVFITLPFVSRELIPLLDSTGIEEEEAGLLLGASPTKVFFKIVTPGIKYGLLYGIILCNARAMGEFGAVSVLSGHIRGQTNTLPLQIEVLYNEYNSVAAFSAASLLVFLSLVTLVAKQILESKIKITRKEELLQEEV